MSDLESTRLLPAEDPTTVVISHPADEAPHPFAGDSRRYALGEEIARGAMGVVYRATDAAFGREVAVKVLQERFAPGSGAARRFADEARITGQLQHPAIPPTHDLGTLPDGRPFLAMKLVRGRTLDALLAERPDPAHDRGRFVAAFEQVCQAVGYAHARRVIHRDLKPANVMVGGFGDVQVMDWGLAKVLGETANVNSAPHATASGTEIRSSRDSDDEFTQAGSALGTPAYMPPEQAIGAVSEMDARSDVFGLGAILAVILTGVPPFAAGSADSARVRAAQGRVGDCFARLDSCGAEPELVQLCKRCLAPEKSERPADGMEVARSVAALRDEAEERARRAELERVRSEASAEEAVNTRRAAEERLIERRKRLRAQLAMAITLGLTLLCGVGIAWWQDRRTGERLARSEGAITVSLDRGEESLRSDDADKAELALEAAEKRTTEGGAERLIARLERLKADLLLLKSLNGIDEFRWARVGHGYPSDELMARRFEEAFRGYGISFEVTPLSEAVGRIENSPVRERLVGALDQWLRHAPSTSVREVLRAIDPDEYRDAVRDTILSPAASRFSDIASEPRSLTQPVEFTLSLGMHRGVPVSRRRELLKAAALLRPGDPRVLMSLGSSYLSDTPFGWEEASRWFQAAVAVRPALHTARWGLGKALSLSRNSEGAIAAFRQAVRLDPSYAFGHSELASLLQEAGDLDEAIIEHRAAYKLLPTIGLREELARALHVKGDIDGAVAELQAGLLHCAFFEREPFLRTQLAMSHAFLGEISLHDRGDMANAVAEFRRAVALGPRNPAYMIRLQSAERYAAAFPRLPGVLAGTTKPASGVEACDLARLCLFPFQKRYSDAVRLFEQGFAAEPRLATELTMSYRYDAACAAARAEHVTEGSDPADLRERLRLRAKAMSWLAADLALHWARAVSFDADERLATVATLNHWLGDEDLTSLRVAEAHINMPEAERAEWAELWAGVRAARDAALKPPPTFEVGPSPRSKSRQ